MITLFRNNRNPLTLLVIALAFVLMFIDYKIENQSSTTIQWIIFIIGLIICLYLQFSELEADIEYLEEHYVLADNRAKKIIQEHNEIDNVLGDFPFFPITTEEVNYFKGDVKMDLSPIQNAEPVKVKLFPKKEIIYREEFNEEINQNNNMETNKLSAPEPGLSTDPQKEQPITSYSLHGIPQKWRAMVDDICSYATRGEKKKLEEIVAKIAIYGQPYKTEKKYHNLVAFKFDFIRIPAVGYFGVKTKEEETKDVK